MSDKWAKSTVCVFRAAWLGTFWVPGGTTGPVFKAEIDMGGSRRRNLTRVFTFSPFSHFAFLTFLSFCIFYELTFFDQSPVLWCYWLKALLHRTEYDVMCGGSPLILVTRFIFVFLFVLFRWRGDSQERRCNFYTPFSPLCLLVESVWICYFMSGRLHRVVLCYTLVLPSVRFCWCFFDFDCSDDGENHRRGELENL